MIEVVISLKPGHAEKTADLHKLRQRLNKHGVFMKPQLKHGKLSLHLANGRVVMAVKGQELSEAARAVIEECGFLVASADYSIRAAHERGTRATLG